MSERMESFKKKTKDDESRKRRETPLNRRPGGGACSRNLEPCLVDRVKEKKIGNPLGKKTQLEEGGVWTSGLSNIRQGK